MFLFIVVCIESVVLWGGIIVILSRAFDSNGSSGKRPAHKHYDDDESPSSSRSERDDWYARTESERYSGHSYGASVSHVVDEGRTYGYNEQW